MSEIIAFFNQKGGCAKTSTCSSVGAAFASLGKRILFVDCDPQANLTVSVSIDDEALTRNIYHLMIEKNLSREIVDTLVLPTPFENIYILPADITLSDAEISLSNAMSRETVLKRIINYVKDDFDFVLLDCPPSLGLLAINALCAADSLIIPVTPDFFSVKGIKHLMSTFEAVKSTINPEITIKGVVLTKFNSRKNISKDIRNTLSNVFGDTLFNTVIRMDSQIEYAQDNLTPIIYYNAKCKAYEDYMNLAKEVLNLG